MSGQGCDGGEVGHIRCVLAVERRKHCEYVDTPALALRGKRSDRGSPSSERPGNGHARRSATGDPRKSQ